MEAVVLILVLLMIGGIGFWVVKKIDVFTEISSQEKHISENRETVIRIACENPIMLPSLSSALEKTSGELERTSFYLYTGSRADVREMLENGSTDIALLMEKTEEELAEGIEKKVSSYTPASLWDPSTGLQVEPVRSGQRRMYVLLNRKYAGEKQRLLFSRF